MGCRLVLIRIKVHLQTESSLSAVKQSDVQLTSGGDEGQFAPRGRSGGFGGFGTSDGGVYIVRGQYRTSSHRSPRLVLPCSTVFQSHPPSTPNFVKYHMVFDVYGIYGPIKLVRG